MALNISISPDTHMNVGALLFDVNTNSYLWICYHFKSCLYHVFTIVPFFVFLVQTIYVYQSHFSVSIVSTITLSFLISISRFIEELADVSSWKVVLGEYNQYLNDIGEQTLSPERFFVHPQFKPHENRNYKY